MGAGPDAPIGECLINRAPDDPEWSAGITLLNDWTSDRHQQLRQIVQYIRSGKFYPADMHVDLIEQIIGAAVQAVEGKTAKAYGGCTNCYGKGYATVNDRWYGHDTDQDIGSPGGYVSGGNPNAIKFCTCGRGNQLQALLESEPDKGNR